MKTAPGPGHRSPPAYGAPTKIFVPSTIATDDPNKSPPRAMNWSWSVLVQEMVSGTQPETCQQTIMVCGHGAPQNYPARSHAGTMKMQNRTRSSEKRRRKERGENTCSEEKTHRVESWRRCEAWRLELAHLGPCVEPARSKSDSDD
eukprot:3098555-Rhodomonas_salina.6